ncbi:hypothetical protein CBR_g19508 [Chara braunii]|uniref:Uncharacterized protein n=1 Tax=Chara braunii TaxID=69332 RepID=A0A388KY64_CHABU|nr:hypothetical protein CBR_g19508 [Chara braunii]|eukprot:GBG74995.1 hypothetical protein CBR_g19508 [Chara braunii]
MDESKSRLQDLHDASKEEFRVTKDMAEEASASQSASSREKGRLTESQRSADRERSERAHMLAKRESKFLLKLKEVEGERQRATERVEREMAEARTAIMQATLRAKEMEAKEAAIEARISSLGKRERAFQPEEHDTMGQRSKMIMEGESKEPGIQRVISRDQRNDLADNQSRDQRNDLADKHTDGSSRRESASSASRRFQPGMSVHGLPWENNKGLTTWSFDEASKRASDYLSVPKYEVVKEGIKEEREKRAVSGQWKEKDESYRAQQQRGESQRSSNRRGWTEVGSSVESWEMTLPRKAPKSEEGGSPRSSGVFQQLESQEKVDSDPVALNKLVELQTTSRASRARLERTTRVLSSLPISAPESARVMQALESLRSRLDSLDAIEAEMMKAASQNQDGGGSIPGCGNNKGLKSGIEEQQRARAAWEEDMQCELEAMSSLQVSAAGSPYTPTRFSATSTVLPPLQIQTHQEQHMFHAQTGSPSIEGFTAVKPDKCREGGSLESPVPRHPPRVAASNTAAAGLNSETGSSSEGYVIDWNSGACEDISKPSRHNGFGVRSHRTDTSPREQQMNPYPQSPSDVRMSRHNMPAEVHHDRQLQSNHPRSGRMDSSDLGSLGRSASSPSATHSAGKADSFGSGASSLGRRKMVECCHHSLASAHSQRKQATGEQPKLATGETTQQLSTGAIGATAEGLSAATAKPSRFSPATQSDWFSPKGHDVNVPPASSTLKNVASLSGFLSSKTRYRQGTFSSSGEESLKSCSIPSLDQLQRPYMNGSQKTALASEFPGSWTPLTRLGTDLRSSRKTTEDDDDVSLTLNNRDIRWFLSEEKGNIAAEETSEGRKKRGAMRSHDRGAGHLISKESTCGSGKEGVGTQSSESRFSKGGGGRQEKDTASRQERYSCSARSDRDGRPGKDAAFTSSSGKEENKHSWKQPGMTGAKHVALASGEYQLELVAKLRERHSALVLQIQCSSHCCCCCCCCWGEAEHCCWLSSAVDDTTLADVVAASCVSVDRTVVPSTVAVAAGVAGLAGLAAQPAHAVELVTSRPAVPARAAYALDSAPVGDAGLAPHPAHAVELVTGQPAVPARLHMFLIVPWLVLLNRGRAPLNGPLL